MAYTEPEPRTPVQERRDEAGGALFVALFLFPIMAYLAFQEARAIRNWYVVTTHGTVATAQVEDLKKLKRTKEWHKWYVNLRWQDASGANASYRGIAIKQSLWHKLEKLEVADRKLDIIYLPEDSGARLPPVVVEDLSSTRFTSIAFALVFSIATLLSGWGIWYNLPIVLGRKV